MADALASGKATLLSRITYGGRNVEEDLESEYERLTEREKSAFRLLTLVGSTTFIPWVLRSLLDVDITEAENLIAQLAEAELLEVAGPDSPLSPQGPLGVARYRFHPLIRSFAQAKLQHNVSILEQRAAQQRLDVAYLELIGRVLVKLDPSLGSHPNFRSPSAIWLSRASTLPDRISELPSQWVRADYKSWIRASIAAFHRQDWTLCWSIATFLGGPIPDYLDAPKCYEVFDLAEVAAERDQDSCAAIEVLLAKATFLLALERYTEALVTFDAAGDRINLLKVRRNSEPAAMRLEAVGHRKLAEGWIQLGAYRRAQPEISQAMSLAQLSDSSIEVDRARLLQKIWIRGRRLTPCRTWSCMLKWRSPQMTLCGSGAN